MAATSSSEAKTAPEPVAGWLSPEEFVIIETVCDTFFPSLEPPPGSSEPESAYYRRKAGDLHVALLLAETLARENEDAQADFRRLLRLMASPAMAPNRIMMFTAHQMGTCCMGADPKASVTNEHAEVHGVKGLFVCDGSLFPALALLAKIAHAPFEKEKRHEPVRENNEEASNASQSRSDAGKKHRLLAQYHQAHDGIARRKCTGQRAWRRYYAHG